MTKAPIQELSPDVFGGDEAALDFYRRLAFVSHAWDDLVDKDREVDPNKLVANLLFHLPANAFFRQYEPEMRALMLSGAAQYMAANLMEKSGDRHQVELAHFLRYGIVAAVSFAITVKSDSLEDAAAKIASAMPVLIPERVGDYMEEHLT